MPRPHRPLLPLLGTATEATSALVTADGHTLPGCEGAYLMPVTTHCHVSPPDVRWVCIAKGATKATSAP